VLGRHLGETLYRYDDQIPTQLQVKVADHPADLIDVASQDVARQRSLTAGRSACSILWDRLAADQPRHRRHPSPHPCATGGRVCGELALIVRGLLLNLTSQGLERRLPRLESRPGRLLPIHSDRGLPGFEVTVRPATSGTIRLGLRCPARSDALEYATAPHTRCGPGAGIRHRGSSNGSITCLTPSMPSSWLRRMALAREETNMASYTDQLARPFEHEEPLLITQRDLARIDRKLTHHSDLSAHRCHAR